MTPTSHSSQKIPKLRFREFQGEWKISSLNSLGIEIIDGDRGVNYPNGNDFSKNGYCLFLNAKNVLHGSFNFEEQSFITKEKDELLNKGKLKRGDIVITTRGTIGNYAYYSNSISFEDMRINSGMVLLRNKDNQIFTEYLYKYLASPQIRKLLKEISFGGAQQQLTVRDIKDIDIPFANISEQQKIASFLSSVDTRIEQLREKKSLLEEYKKGVIQKIFAREINFKDEKGEEYGEWEEKEFDDVFNSIGTKPYQVKSSDILQNGEFPVIDQGQNMIAGYSNDSSRLLKNTPVIVFGDHTTILKYIDFNFIVGADGTKVLKNLEGNLKYLFYFLDFNRPKQEGYKRHFSVLRELTVLFPTLPEQQKIAAFLSEIDSKIQSTTEQLEEAEKWKKGLLQGMFV